MEHGLDSGLRKRLTTHYGNYLLHWQLPIPQFVRRRAVSGDVSGSRGPLYKRVFERVRAGGKNIPGNWSLLHFGNYLIAGIILFTTVVHAESALYVTPDGLPGNTGDNFSTALDYATALSRVSAGDTVVVQGGTYTIPYQAHEKNTILFTKSGSAGKPICMITALNSRAIFNFSYPDNSKVIDENVTSYGFHITGSYWYFKGIAITKAGYQGAYVSGTNITFENCMFYENWNSGLEINKGGSNISVVNCDAYRNFDSSYKNGGMADGFAPKQTQGSGNRFVGCRAWENSDDGFDTYDSPESVTFDNCWAFRNGVNVWKFSGFSGNGNGFKIGGNEQLQNNKLTRCIAFGNPKKGFDQNNNTGGLTIYNCVGFANGTNFGLGGALASGQQHRLSNNVSLSGAVSISNAVQKNNTWNSGFTVSITDFISVDTSNARTVRNPDGTLQVSDLFRPEATGTLIDRGIDVGLPYSGRAPDIGCFESATVQSRYEPTQRRVAGSLKVVNQDGAILELASIASMQGGVCALFSIQGKCLLRQSVENGFTARINIAKLVPGIYIANLSGPGILPVAVSFVK